MEFSERYKTYSDEKLIEILLEKDQYQKEAILAAEEELQSRNISIDEIERQESNYEDISTEEEESRIKMNELLELPSKSIGIIKKFINPKNKCTSEELAKVVAIILFFFAAKAIYWAYLEFRYYAPIDYEDLQKNQIQIWLGSILLPVAGSILLWNRKSLGWILSTIYAVNMFLTEIPMLHFNLLNYQYIDKIKFLSNVVLWALLGVMVYNLQRKDVIEYLKLSSGLRWVTTISILIYSVWQVVLLINYMNSYN